MNLFISVYIIAVYVLGTGEMVGSRVYMGGKLLNVWSWCTEQFKRTT